MSIDKASQKYCSECAAVIMRHDAFCPRCGGKQSSANDAAPNLQPPSAGVGTAPPHTKVVAPENVTRDLKLALAGKSGQKVLLIVGNFLWNGLGNLIVGDKRGWFYGYFNWVMVAIGIFTYWIPVLIWCGYCTIQGVDYVNKQPN